MAIFRIIAYNAAIISQRKIFVKIIFNIFSGAKTAKKLAFYAHIAVISEHIFKISAIKL